jgi:hypothetical protein
LELFSFEETGVCFRKMSETTFFLIFSHFPQKKQDSFPAQRTEDKAVSKSFQNVERRLPKLLLRFLCRFTQKQRKAVRAHVCRFRKNSRISLVLPEFFLKI